MISFFENKSFRASKEIFENTPFAFLTTASRTSDTTNPNAISMHNNGIAGKRGATIHYPSIQAFLRAAQADTFENVNGYGHGSINTLESMNDDECYIAEFVENDDFVSETFEKTSNAPVTMAVCTIHNFSGNKKRVNIESGVIVKNEGKPLVKDYVFDADFEPHADGAAFIYMMMPILMKDKEFSQAMEELCRYYKEVVTNAITSTTESDMITVLFRMCDNFYRRCKMGEFKMYEEALQEKAIGVITGGKTHIAKYKDITPTAGTFYYFSENRNKAKSKKKVKNIDIASLKGAYRMNDRQLTPEEEQRIPEMAASYVIPKELSTICTHIVDKDNIFETPIRNILFRGEAGTGKTELATALASALYRPKCTQTFSANTEIFDIVGQFIPVADDEESKDTIENFWEGMPDLMDICMNPQIAYKAVTGIEKKNATSNDVLSIVTSKLASCFKENGNAQRFKYVETPFIEAIRKGYVIELQEPTVIANPGVLVGLNSLLDNCKEIALPNGEIVKRHPDTVVIVTTNVDYNGCQSLNQSFLSRMQLKFDMKIADKNVIIDRVQKKSGLDNKEMLSKMYKVYELINKYCSNNGITDGCCGVRELIAWAQSYRLTGDIVESAMITIIPSATADEEEQAGLVSSTLNAIF